MPTRYDISAVPPQGGYVAKRCPVRVQNDTLQPAVPIPPSVVLQRRFDRGIEFEKTIFGRITALHPQAIQITATDPEAAQQETKNAMDAGASIILGGWLPTDLHGRRVGRPDILIAARGGGYRAVDVKNHLTLEVAPPATSGSRKSAPKLSALASPLDTPKLESAAIDAQYLVKKRENDALQLAHYQRMLEAMEMAAGDGRRGGIIGVEGVVVWYDLDAPIWQTPSISEGKKYRSSLERYDFEFDFRLDVIACSLAHKHDPAASLLVVPVKTAECETCPWWDYCRPELEAGAGDVSLLPRVNWPQWKAHRDLGTTDRHLLANLDWRTAQVVDAGIDAAELMAMAGALEAESPLIEVPALGKRPAQRRTLETIGLATAGDVLSLDRGTAKYFRAGISSLGEQIDQARAALGAAPVYRRRGVTQVIVPRADIEVDVDMENIEEGVYLWGTYVTVKQPLPGISVGYNAFATWKSMSAQTETENSWRFWRWLMQLRDQARDARLTFAAYCYNAGAENQYLRKLGLGAGIAGEIDDFIASEEWVDMLKVWDRHFITGHGSGLKLVAPIAGHQWEVDDPDGGESMLRYEASADPAAREWLLTYNRGDVVATWRLREWMEICGGQVPAIETQAPS